jgi:hypothetical protein
MAETLREIGELTSKAAFSEMPIESSRRWETIHAIAIYCFDCRDKNEHARE